MTDPTARQGDDAVAETDNGQITLYDTNHHIVAHTGDGLRATGEMA